MITESTAISKTRKDLRVLLFDEKIALADCVFGGDFYVLGMTSETIHVCFFLARFTYDSDIE